MEITRLNWWLEAAETGSKVASIAWLWQQKREPKEGSLFCCHSGACYEFSSGDA